MLAFLYPGQGDQRAGMIAALPAEPAVTEVLDIVSDTIGGDIRDLDTADVLEDTVAAQLALFTVGVAWTRALQEREITPDAVLGHSIGAFAAAVAADVLTTEAAARAVRVRASLMRDLYPHGYGLLAVLGARLRDVRRLVDDVGGDHDLFVAMENAEDQIVLAGSDSAFQRVVAAAGRFGVRNVRRLAVAVPSHCPLMVPVTDAVRKRLGHASRRSPSSRYFAASTAREARTGADVLEDLARGVSETVHWRDTTTLLAEKGTTGVLQLPPGHTTASLFVADHSAVPCVSLDGSRFEDAFLIAQRLLR